MAQETAAGAHGLAAAAPGGEGGGGAHGHQAEASGAASLDLLLDVPLRVTVQLGGTRLTIRELLLLGHGSVVELDKPGGEPLDVLVNGKPIARGEAVIVNEKFGVRLTQIISPSARVENLA
jgi:flagellar motor switch protein FliN/FliY